MNDRTWSRGQAIIETALVVPLFLFGLFGVIWAMKDASLAARVELAVRYAGMVDSLQQPYQAYSLYTMYATIDDVVPATNASCYNGNGSQLAAGYSPFWFPTSSGPLVSPCASAIVVVTGSETFSQPIILRNNYSSITATVPVNGFVSRASMNGLTSSTVRAAENFFRSPDVGALLTCTSLGVTAKATLEGKGDTGVPASFTTAMPIVLPATTIVTGTSGACAPTTSTFNAPSTPY